MQSEPPAGDAIRFSGQGTDRSFYLPRLAREHYQGDAVIHWTMPIARRGTGWLNELLHARFRQRSRRAAIENSPRFQPWVSAHRELSSGRGDRFVLK